MNGEQGQERTNAITASVDKESINIPDPKRKHFERTVLCESAPAPFRLRLLRLLLPRRLRELVGLGLEAQ